MGSAATPLASIRHLWLARRCLASSMSLRDPYAVTRVNTNSRSGKNPLTKLMWDAVRQCQACVQVALRHGSSSAHLFTESDHNRSATAAARGQVRAMELV